MNTNSQINLLKGYNSFNFGKTILEAEQLFGKPEETQVLNDDVLDTSCTVLHYWQQGFSLFFDNKNFQKFSSVEVDNEETTLFNQLIFDLKEQELIALMKEHNFELSDSERQEWGEKRVSFDEAGLDCYYENGKLSSINFGVIEEHTTFDFLAN